MKRLLFIGAIAVSVPFMAGAQTTTPATTTPAVPAVTLPDPGLLPGDFFYFLDRWGEDISSFFAFSPAAKARLALEHAQERASEVHAVLQKKGADAPEVKQAKQDFEQELNQAATIVADEKAKGSDVSALAKEVNDEFEVSKDMLKEAYHGYNDNLKETEKNLQEELNKAIQAGDTAAQTAIRAEIDRTAGESAKVLGEEGSVEGGFDAQKQDLEEAMGAQQSAESHIANAERAYQDFVQHAQEKGLTPNQTVVDSYTQLIAKAKEALAAGDFETAKENAKDAKSALEDARQSIDMKDTEKSFFEGMPTGGDEGSAEMTTDKPEKPEAGSPGEKDKPEAGLRVKTNEGEGAKGAPETPASDGRPDGQE